MPVTLSQIADNTAKVTLQVSTGETVSELDVEFYPNHLTEETFAHMKRYDESAGENIIEGLSSLNEILALLIKKWDLYTDDANTQMYPLDVNSLKKLPMVFRVGVLHGIMGAIRPNHLAPQMIAS